MSYSLFVLSQTYLNSGDVLSQVEKASSKLNFKFDKHSASWANVFLPEEDTVEVHIVDKIKFDEMKANGTFVPGYSAICYFTIYTEKEYDDIAVPLLKEILKIYPGLLVSNEEVDNGPFVFNKLHFDTFKGTEFSFLTRKPEN